MRRKVPGLFAFFAGRIPVAALPRASRPERPAGGIGIRACLRNTLLRVRIPGGAPDLFLREREFAPLFYNLDVAKRPRRAQRALGLPMGRAAGRRACARDSRRSRRLTVRTAALQAVYAGSNPAGNANDFSLAVAQPGQRASFGTGRPQVRILPARPINTSVAQRTRARGYEPRGRRFESFRGCQPNCRADSCAADPDLRRVTQWRE